MDEEMLRRILKEELNPIKASIVKLEKNQEEFKNMLVDLEATNAIRHTEMSLKVEEKVEELKDLKKVIKENCYDIAKLKAVI